MQIPRPIDEHGVGLAHIEERGELDVQVAGRFRQGLPSLRTSHME